MKTNWNTAAAMLAAAAIAGLALSGPVHAQSAADLKAKHASLKDALQQSAFRRPVVLESDASASEPHGDVYAVVNHPFAAVGNALKRGEQWCDVLMLQPNVKRCASEGNLLKVAITRRYDKPVSDAYQVQFKYTVPASDADYHSVQMAADSGPLGTRDYKLGLEAVPLDAGHTFIHMSYSYASGVAARLATDAYLATSGRDKVGFSAAGNDATGKPTLVNGVRGVAERNTMRYFLAIEAVLKTASLPAGQQDDSRLREFFTSIERYPRQLKEEFNLSQYVAMKKQEAQAQ